MIKADVPEYLIHGVTSWCIYPLIKEAIKLSKYIYEETFPYRRELFKVVSYSFSFKPPHAIQIRKTFVRLWTLTDIHVTV